MISSTFRADIARQTAAFTLVQIRVHGLANWCSRRANRCSRSMRIGVHVGCESVFTLRANTQLLNLLKTNRPISVRRYPLPREAGFYVGGWTVGRQIISQMSSKLPISTNIVSSL